MGKFGQHKLESNTTLILELRIGSATFATKGGIAGEVDDATVCTLGFDS